MTDAVDMDEWDLWCAASPAKALDHALPVGNVRMAARQLQPVRITTREECKIPAGLLDGDRQGNQRQRHARGHWCALL